MLGEGSLEGEWHVCLHRSGCRGMGDDNSPGRGGDRGLCLGKEKGLSWAQFLCLEGAAGPHKCRREGARGQEGTEKESRILCIWE